VLLERVEKRGRPEEKPIRREYLREVAKAYSEFFFRTRQSAAHVDASEIDFVGNAEDARPCWKSSRRHVPV